MAVDLDVAGAGANLEGRAAAVDGRGEVMARVVVLLGSAGEVDVDVAGAGGGFEVEVGVGGEVQPDAAGAGGEIGCSGEVTFGLDIAGAAARHEATVEAMDFDVCRSRSWP